MKNYDLNLLDDYLRDKLSPSEKVSFENGLQSDPALQEEVNLQKEIIESLKNNRAASLKARMNAIDVSSIPESSNLGILAKIAAGLVLVGSVGVAAYYYQSADNGHLNEKSSHVDPLHEDRIPIMPKESGAEVLNEKESVVIMPNASEKLVEKTPAKVHKAKETIVETPVLNEVTFTEPSLGTTSKDANMVSSNANRVENQYTKIDDSDKSKFHYKFENQSGDKILTLFGNFKGGKKPYELIESNKKDTQGLFMVYKSEFYILKFNTTKESPIEKITDSETIKVLQNIQNK